MTEIMPQLEPIAAIVGPSSVKADYSQVQVEVGYAEYRPGWRVQVDGSYKGARVKIEKTATSLDQAAGDALAELKQALGIA